MDADPCKEITASAVQKIDWESFSPSIQKLIDSPSFYLQMVVYKWEKGIQDLLLDFDLTNTQFKILASLMILTKDQRIITQMDVANLLNADKMMVSEVIRKLEKKGYVVRASHPTDRRAKSLIVTQKGLDAVETAVQRAAWFDEIFFSPLGGGLESFTGMLKKLK
jgi:DNA-binding MarR family transcriptional regulator